MPTDPRKHTKPQMRWEDVDIPTLEAEVARLEEEARIIDHEGGQLGRGDQIGREVEDAKRVLAWAKGELYQGRPAPDLDKQLADLGFSSLEEYNAAEYARDMKEGGKDWADQRREERLESTLRWNKRFQKPPDPREYGAATIKAATGEQVAKARKATKAARGELGEKVAKAEKVRDAAMTPGSAQKILDNPDSSPGMRARAEDARVLSGTESPSPETGLQPRLSRKEQREALENFDTSEYEE